MIRLRRLPPTRVLRRPAYEVDFGPASASGAPVRRTTTPATLIDSHLGVAAAWQLVAAADAAWSGGTGPWVTADGLAAAEAPVHDAGQPGNPLTGRAFQLWEYGAGHGGLLIRSPKGQGGELNVDVVFDRVRFVSCPLRLPDLSIVQPEPDDLAAAHAAVGDVERASQVFVLLSDGRRHLVVASGCRVIEHAGSPAASPFSPARFSRGWWSDVFSGDR